MAGKERQWLITWTRSQTVTAQTSAQALSILAQTDHTVLNSEEVKVTKA